jgi:hypothetical protein
MSTYVTRGTIQVEINCNTSPKNVKISPTPDYSIKHDKQDYLVFVEKKEKNGTEEKKGTEKESDTVYLKNGIVFTKDQAFPIDESMLSGIMMVALQRIAIEIEIEIKDESAIKVSENDLKITTIRIPATRN